MSEALNNRQAEQKCKKDEVLADKGAKSKHEKRKSHVSPSSTDQQSADDDISAKNKTPNSRPEKRKRETSCSFVYVYSFRDGDHSPPVTTGPGSGTFHLFEKGSVIINL